MMVWRRGRVAVAPELLIKGYLMGVEQRAGFEMRGQMH